MAVKKSNYIFFWTTLFILLICMILIAVFSGFQHEAKKFKSLLVTIVEVLLFQYLFADPIKFTLLAIDAACWPPKQCKFATDREPKHHNRLDYLKLRLRSLKSQLVITEQHRDEKLNEKYKRIAQDLWLYGKYFFFLLMMVLVTHDHWRYFNTHNLQRMFNANHSVHFGLNEVFYLNQVLSFIEESLIDAFDPNISLADGAIEHGWIHGEQNKMLGVVRLRQCRLEDRGIGLSSQTFTTRDYMPRWELPYKRVPYTDKYWRIYEPWLPMKTLERWIDHLLLNFDHQGYFANYPEQIGYVTLLARTKQNSLKILEYIDQYEWLSYKTAALFMDFTLYNVDVNLFSVCTLFVEQTPFGSIIPHVEVESVYLLEDLDQMSPFALVVLLMYILVVIQFAKVLVLKLWYDRSELKSLWNHVDLIIVMLNIAIVVFTLIREWLVEELLKRLEGVSKLEFIDFRVPMHLQRITTITIGFLICITTLRLWKIMQFASVFQLFTHTLYISWKAVASTAIVIAVFLIAFGIAVDTINGNNSANFVNLIQSIVTCMCFSFGYSNQITPEDLFFGGKYLGVIIYVVMAFVIAVLLINIFVSLINDYFSTAKAMRDMARQREINFLQFLRAEYADKVRFILQVRCCRKSYRSRNRTVAENVRRELKASEKRARKEKQRETVGDPSRGLKADEHTVQELYKRRLERMYTVAAIMQTQLEIIDRLLFENDRKAPG